MSDIWTTIAAERGALADDLANLTPAQWDTPSLCSGCHPGRVPGSAEFHLGTAGPQNLLAR